ncbi:AAA family ATPase [Helicobacter pullorum]|uniref:AAA family ATPase n=1 Tax=Helicobacter pullorum TaxID=35818 RepID=UPI001F3A9DE6|nr:ATP-binding protein [Helicobacter pullorum]
MFFGGNASGKTNFFVAVKILLSIIKYGLSHTLREHITNNAFNKNSDSIALGIELSDNKKSVFSYFIEFDSQKVIRESFRKNDRDIFLFGEDKATFKNEQLQSFFSRRLSENILYFLKDFEIKECSDFMDIINDIEVYMSSSYSKDYILDFNEARKNYFIENKNNILDIFKILDRTIDDFSFEELEKEDKSIYRIYFIRNGQHFSYQVESEGIKKIVQLADKFLEVVKGGKVLFIDELDSSISTSALIKIFNNLINTEENTNGQIIVSSHNLLLFDVSFLSSQQIFLVQKNFELETIIKNYYDFDIRSEKKRAYIDYLKGLYDEDE